MVQQGQAGRQHTVTQQAIRTNLSLSRQPEADTEYADPFDAQPQLPALDDGYMEPYDSQTCSSGERTGLGTSAWFCMEREGDQCLLHPRTAKQSCPALRYSI